MIARRAWLVGAMALALAAPAGAVPTERARREARAMLKAGNEAFEKGDYQAALELYQSAQQRSESGKLFLNIGTALRKLGREVEAAGAYERYLREVVDVPADKRKEVESELADIDGRVGHLRVDASESGATIVIDASTVGLSPLAAPLRWPAGKHTVRASKQGFSGAEREVTVAPGEQVTVGLVLEAERSAPSTVPPIAPATTLTPAVALPPSPSATAEPAAVVHVAAPPTEQGWSHRRHVAGLAGVDVDDDFHGIVTNVGVSYGVGDRVELTVAALIGAHAGGRLGAALFVGPTDSRLKAGLAGAFTFFAAEKFYPGVHAGVVAALDVTRTFTVLLQAAVEHFPTNDSGERTMIVPSLAVAWRLF